MTNNHLKQLSIADPELAAKVITRLKQKGCIVSSQNAAILVDETIWGLSQETSFGHAIASGFVNLIGETDQERIKKYKNQVREAGLKGPTLGRIIATYLVPVLICGDDRLLESFIHAIDIMQQKGTYTLTSPLEALSSLLNAGDIESGAAYLDLLCGTFIQDLTYNQSQHFSYILPKAIRSFSPLRKSWQIKELSRVIRADFHLAEPFLEGMDKGLHLLSKKALGRFVSLGLEKFQKQRRLGVKFLSLESKSGMDTYQGLQVTVPVCLVQQQLNRYLCARTGLAISVRPLSLLPKSFVKEDSGFSVFSDGKFIYLPDEINTYGHKAENITLYKCLTRLEAGLYEFNTFDFDLEKVMERCGQPKTFPFCKGGSFTWGDEKKNLSDLERFFLSFPIKDLASDLFSIFEHGRLRIMLTRQYPGLVRKFFPMLQREANRILNEDKPVEAIFLLYSRVALGIVWKEDSGINKIKKEVDTFADLFENKMAEDNAVEACAELVIKTYHGMEDIIKKTSGCHRLEDFYRPMKIPFGRRLRPDLYFSNYQNYERLAKTVKIRLKEKGIKVYKSDLKKRLIQKNGIISHDDIKEIILTSQEHFRSDELQHQDTGIDLSWLDLSGLLGEKDAAGFENDAVSCPVFWYREWDNNLGDYLNDHVRVLDRDVTGCESDFYERTLKRHIGLVRRIRYSFELLKPEGLTILRRWLEGDEFDYRALLDFAIDKKSGRMPSDRLYIKRIKQQRDVAVLLLVDLSRSTANTVFGSQATVLDVEKEAIVLFCEALEVVGDAFAIAGFSGTGRLGVDYYRIKDFDVDMDDNIMQRINAMAPQRSTRMGAAIRHGTSQLENIPSKVRLMIILGDGFPNDVGYKRDYAIEDTRKAIFEARSKNIYVHAITVNIAGDSKLDDLYGNVHHNVISDVRELPDKLLRIYSALTR